ncbi:MAG: Uma2 family endonuclease [Nodosilinea sp.]
MTTQVSLPLPPSAEQALTLPGRYPWKHFKRLQRWADQTPGLKITYLDGAIELMTTGKPHERVKKLIAILIEAYCFELGMRFFPSGNATCEAEEKGASFNPDESYCFDSDKDYPDLAIEVVFTSGGLEKLEKYRRFNVTEVWFWQNKRLAIYGLTPTAASDPTYQLVDHSCWLPDLDVALLEHCIQLGEASQARTQFLAALRSHS